MGHENKFVLVPLKILRQCWLSHQICWERRLSLGLEPQRNRIFLENPFTTKFYSHSTCIYEKKKEKTVVFWISVYTCLQVLLCTKSLHSKYKEYNEWSQRSSCPSETFATCILKSVMQDSSTLSIFTWIIFLSGMFVL